MIWLVRSELKMSGGGHNMVDNNKNYDKTINGLFWTKKRIVRAVHIE